MGWLLVDGTYLGTPKTRMVEIVDDTDDFVGNWWNSGRRRPIRLSFADICGPKHINILMVVAAEEETGKDNEK